MELGRKMTWIDGKNAATTLNGASLPTRIILHNIKITPGMHSKILHSQLSSLILSGGVCFFSKEKSLGGTADDFFAEVIRCEQLKELFVYTNTLKAPIKELVYRSSLSLTLESLSLASIDHCRSLIVAQFFKAICSTS